MAEELAQRLPSISTGDVEYEQVAGPVNEVAAHHGLVPAVLRHPGVDVDLQQVAVILAGRLHLLVLLHVPAPTVDHLVEISDREEEAERRLRAVLG